MQDTYMRESLCRGYSRNRSAKMDMNQEIAIRARIQKAMEEAGAAEVAKIKAEQEALAASHTKSQASVDSRNNVLNKTSQ